MNLDRRRPRRKRGGASMFMDGYITRRKRYDDDDDDIDLSTTINQENRPKTAAELSTEILLKNETHSIYPIGGVKIKFPCKPYPSQFSMMGMIVKGLDRSQNCLLESPTGSGKSLALLCSVLAWQQAYKDKSKEESSAEPKEGKECSCKRGDKSVVSSHFSTTLANLADESLQTDATDDNSSIIIDDDDDDDDFKKPVKKLRKSLQGQGAAGGRPRISISYESTPTATGATPTPRGGATPMDEDRGCCDCQCQQDPPPNRKTPKIYFGTRTHKQIAQIARELAKTAYSEVRLSILSSREQTCIDLEVSKLRNKSEGCKDKRDGAGCLHYENVRKVTHRNLAANGLEYAWDLEDLVGFCRKNRACPYYGARGLREGAEIIFCPYNYLIDPVIRTQMEISLKGEVVVLDEAHNMEDAAREAASYSVSHLELEDAMADFKKVIGAEIKIREHMELMNVVSSLGEWVDSFKDSLGGDNYDDANRVWNGVDMVAQLKKYKIGPEDMARIQQCLGEALEEDPDEPPRIKITNATAVIIEKTLFVLGYIFRDNYKFMNDYRIALVRTISYTAEQTDGQWLGKNRRTSNNPTWLFTLHFWCMNPAVAFSDLANTRSIILTSGTLSPMNTFQSELAQPFPIQLEANHVINSKQVWVGAVSKGPRGNSLLGTYQNAETFTYQDEIGQLALSVCKSVPHGVLCFLSSYRMMDKLLTRWQNTGLYSELNRYKVLMKEPRKSDKEKVDFDELLKEFYATIKDTEHANAAAGEQTGVFFMAVCRGKVSEGMDFADNNARAVITVGIPFPNVKDTQVGLKKKYNNEHSQKRGLLTGQDWYEIQAYRAINQALGRCIRHRYDWGALILVDERFAKNPAKYTKGLSKWVRGKVQYHGNFSQMQRSLQEFTENMVTTPPGPGQDQSMSVSQMMDTSVAVDATPRPYSPGPPVLPPHPASSTSPPMDLHPPQTPGAAIGHTSSLSVSHTRAPGYMLSSQAGGFMVSQPVLNRTVSSAAGGTQPAHTQEDVLAAPPDTQHMNLDQTLEFAPPISASTQRPGGLSFNPGFTSTQRSTQQTEAGFLDVSLIKPPFKTPVKSNVPTTSVSNHGVSPLATVDTKVNKAPPKCETLSAPVLSFKQKTVKRGWKNEDDDDPDFEIPRSQSAKTSGTSKRLSQCVDLTVRCGDEELDIDERSSSPLLFDSEEGDEVKRTEADFDAVVEHLADTTLPLKPPQVHELKYSESTPNLGLKALFKPRKNTIKEEESTVSLNDSNTVCRVTENIDKPTVERQDENVPPILVDEPAKPKHAKGRLSRRRSKDSMNSSLLSQTPDPKDRPSDKAEKAIQNNPNQSDNSDSITNKSVTQTNLRGAPRLASKRVANRVNSDSEGEVAEEEADEIVTKRANRNKRRRVLSASNHTSTSDFLDDVQATVKVEVSEAVCCKCCGIRLTKDVEGVMQEDLPGYVKSVIPVRYQRNVRVGQKSSVCTHGNTCLSACRPLHATTTDGIKLNSVWSEEAGCCLVFYRCPTSQCSNAPVAIRITATATNSTATEGQVWFLPHTTVVSEPT